MGRQVVISFATTPIPLAVSRIVSWPLTPWGVSGFRLSSHMLLDFLRERLLIKDMVVSQQRYEQEKRKNNQENS